MTDMEKLRVLLPHWITHNEDHCSEFVRWAALCEESGDSDVARALERAIDTTKQVTIDLQTALERAGGPLEISSDNHRHGHSHR
jgi:hypothetical protein